MVNGSTEDGWYKRSDEVVIEYFEAKTDEEIALEHPGEIKIDRVRNISWGKIMKK